MKSAEAAFDRSTCSVLLHIAAIEGCHRNGRGGRCRQPQDEPESSFDDLFLKREVNQILKSVFSTMYVVVVTHKGHSRCVDWSGLLAVHYEEE